MHQLRKIHADPHPGNFLMRDDGTVGIFDFGCIKEIPEDFYENYFMLVDKEILKDEAKRMQIYTNLEMIHPTDTEKEITFFSGLFQKMIDLLTLPFTQNSFDFGNEDYFREIYAYMDYVYNLKEVRDSKVARGSRHSLYVNRTYFGLYSILSDLRAEIHTGARRFKTLMQ
jgi:predicted unusual protein kinase regulating ubiquinone biosynthesis (AarF/ABC1/UbiB family)